MHDQTKTQRAAPRLVTKSMCNARLRRLLPTVAGAALALGVGSGVASAAGYGGGDDDWPACELIGCPNGNRECATMTGAVKMPSYIPYSPLMPYFGDSFYTEIPFSATCYEPPMY